MTVRHALIVLNLVAGVALVLLVIGFVFSKRSMALEKKPQNIAPALPDAELESRKLERVLGVALVFTVTIAAGLALYWLWEPNRQADATKGFDSRAVERGEILFSNKQMKTYDPTKSLLCANCHGTDAGGGATTFVLKAEDPTCKAGEVDRPECLPKQVTWKAPALDTVFYRFPRGKKDCTTAQKIDLTVLECHTQVTDIITYGRPGTPMPAWGVASGKGVLNEQGISDLVAYLESVQLPSDKAKAQISSSIDDLKKQATDGLDKAQKNLAAAKAALAAAASPTDKADRQKAVDAATAALASSQAFAGEVAKAGDGELLFLTNCARCHTKGWSYVDPSNPETPQPAPPGSGAFGPNLRDGSETRQFPNPADQATFIAQGSQFEQAYGVRGIGSGRMPGFGTLLTKDQIDAIVAYERSL